MNAPVDYDALLAQLAPHLSKGELEQCELMRTRAPGGFRRQVAALAQKYAKQLASPPPEKETPRQADGPGEAAEIKESSRSIDLDISASAMTPSACRAASGTISIMVHHLPPSAMLDGCAWRAGGRPRRRRGGCPAAAAHAAEPQAGQMAARRVVPGARGVGKRYSAFKRLMIGAHKL
jgi:hypothetical protein